MCGISGIYHYGKDVPVDRSMLEQMNDAISHRGPDGYGFHVDGKIGLGHRRLSIIDLAEGDQPIYNHDGSIAIVFNGEIYNYRELREQLLALGYVFKTHSDTEVIVHLYQEKGVACLEELNGMFCFAIWDNNRQRLFVARDRLGEKPFYYSKENGKFLFSSELKSLAKHPDIKRTLNLQAMDDYLSYGYVPAPRSIFDGVHKLPAAHYLLVENGSVAIHRYWDIPFNTSGAVKTEGEYVEELKRLLNESVNIRLRSDVPVGAFLSGGIDSSLMVALCAQQAEQPISTFSVGFHEQDFDELRYAKQVAEKYGTKHNEIILESLDLSMFPGIVEHFDEPFGDASAIPTYYVTKMAAEKVKVCISGDAGDELFCGYERYQYETLEKELDLLPAKARELFFGLLDKLSPESFFAKGRIRRAASSQHERWQRKMGAFDNLERANLYRPEYQQHLDQSAWYFKGYFDRPDLSLPEQGMLADQHTYLTDDILVKVDRNSMWHGLEVRVPFLDHRIVEFANALPMSMKMRGMTQKYIVKEILKSLVPEEIITRPKRGFGLPLKHWLKDEYYEYSRELLLASDSKVATYLNQSYIEKIIQWNKSGKRDMSKRIWTLMWLEQWLRSNMLQ